MCGGMSSICRLQCPGPCAARSAVRKVFFFRMERPALFVGDAEEGAATLNEDEVRFH